MKSMHLFETYWTETNILAQQQKLSQNKAIIQPKFDRWLPISSLTCILQWYKLFQTWNEIYESLQKLLSRNKKCDYDTNDKAATAKDAGDTWP